MKDRLIGRKVRDSNIELFRIVLMLLIMAHHYVVNSGLMDPVREIGDVTFNKLYLPFLGAFGKAGINAFILITGYFMCTQYCTWLKFLKLFLEVKFYSIGIWLLFIMTGIDSFSSSILFDKLTGISLGLGKGFTPAFIFLFLLIPYINKMIGALSKIEFRRLLFILILIQSVIGTFLLKSTYYEYLPWYVTIYLIGAYIRLYPNRYMNSLKYTRRAMIASILAIGLSTSAIVYVNCEFSRTISIYYFVVDSHKILALAVSVSMFLFFKNIKIKPNRLINTIASTTFGILLIHGHSDLMRELIWRKLFRNVEFYNSDYLWLHSIVAVSILYAVCSALDYIRIKALEKPLFSYLSNKYPRLNKPW